MDLMPVRPIDAYALVEWLKKLGRLLKIEEDHKRTTALVGKIIDHIEDAPTIIPIEFQRETSLCQALIDIVWYDGHEEWLKPLSAELRQCPPDKNYRFEVDAWHTEQHAIWMLLVGMFGNWGTSIRGGWIEKKTECADFIDAICHYYEEGGVDNNE